MCSVSRRQHSGGSDIVEWDTGPPNREHLATCPPQGQRAPRGHRQAGRGNVENGVFVGLFRLGASTALAADEAKGIQIYQGAESDAVSWRD